MPERVEIFARRQRPPKMLRDRFSHKLLGPPDRLFQRQAGRNTSGNRRRIGATGTMRCDAGDERRRELDNFPIDKKKKGRQISRAPESTIRISKNPTTSRMRDGDAVPCGDGAEPRNVCVCGGRSAGSGGGGGAEP